MGRFDYVRYDAQAQGDQAAFKSQFEQTEMMIEERLKGATAAKQRALRKLEEAYMWLGKALRDEQIARNGAAELLEERGNA